MKNSTKVILGLGAAVGAAALLSSGGNDKVSRAPQLERLMLDASSDPLGEAGQGAMREAVRRGDHDAAREIAKMMMLQERKLAEAGGSKYRKPYDAIDGFSHIEIRPLKASDLRPPALYQTMYFRGAKLCWSERHAGLFLADLADEMHDIIVEEYEEDFKPTQQLAEVIRQYAIGAVGKKTMSDARDDFIALYNAATKADTPTNVPYGVREFFVRAASPKSISAARDIKRYFVYAMSKGDPSIVMSTGEATERFNEKLWSYLIGDEIGCQEEV